MSTIHAGLICLSIEVNGRTVGTFGMVHGCPLLSGVRRGSTVYSLNAQQLNNITSIKYIENII